MSGVHQWSSSRCRVWIPNYSPFWLEVNSSGELHPFVLLQFTKVMPRSIEKDSRLASKTMNSVEKYKLLS